MRLQQIVWLLVLSVASSASARDIFVNNLAGDDGFLGTLPATRAGDNDGPVATINRALELVQPGDRIIVAKTSQPYKEMLSLSSAKHCGSPAQPFVIEGGGATLDGSQPIPHEAWEPYRGPIFRFRPAQMSYQQLFIDGLPAVRRRITSVTGTLPKLEPRQWCLHQGFIYFRVEDDKMPVDYRLSHTSLPVGITLYHVHHVIIADLVVQGFQLDGVNAFDGTRECYLGGMNCRGNGRSGLAVAGCSQLDVRDSIVGDNGTSQVYTEALSVTNIHGTQLLANTAPAVVREGGQVFVDGKRVEGVR
jgi:hypothetical protein